MSTIFVAPQQFQENIVGTIAYVLLSATPGNFVPCNLWQLRPQTPI
jgi:hypothetical protein